MSDDKMTTGADPQDYNAGPVEDHLKEADAAEVRRVLALETGEGGKDRKGVKDAAEARLAELDAADPGTVTDQTDPDAKPSGLATTGNPNDLAHPIVSEPPGIGHQDSAPEELKAADDAARAVGYIGESAEKPDYSQANPAVMNRAK